MQRFNFTAQKTAASNNCVDIAPNCSENRNLCHLPVYTEIMKEKCKKTCSFCKDNATNQTACTDFMIR